MKYLSNTFLRHSLILLSGTFLSQCLAVALSPILTRLYKPEDFGFYAVYIAVISIMLMVGSLQYEKAILIPAEEKEALHVLALSGILIILVFVLSIIGFYFFGRQIFTNLKTPELHKYWWLFSLGFLGAALYQILANWAIRQKAYKNVAQARLKQSSAMVILQIVFGLINPGLLGLLAGDAMGRLGGSGSLFTYFSKGGFQKNCSVSLPALQMAAVRYKKFPMFSASSALVKEFGRQLPAFVLTMVYSPEIVGCYVLVQRILGLPLSLVADSVANVFMVEAADLNKKNPLDLTGFFLKTLRNLFLITAPLTLIVGCTAPWAVPYIFGESWRDSGLYLPILSIMYFLQYLATSVSSTVLVLERNELHLIRECFHFILLSMAVILLSTNGLSPLQGITAMSAAGSLGYITNILISWLAIKQNLARRKSNAS